MFTAKLDVVAVQLLLFVIWLVPHLERVEKIKIERNNGVSYCVWLFVLMI